jgi:hypothetical protein
VADEANAPTGAAGGERASHRDRGASAVEWVVITAIVVAIVTGVGWGISKAIGNKSNSTVDQINKYDPNNGPTGQ